MTIPRTCDVRRDGCDYREWVACGGMFKRWEGAGEAGARRLRGAPQGLASAAGYSSSRNSSIC